MAPPNPPPDPIVTVARESADELLAMAERLRRAIGDERSDLRGYAGRA